MVPRALLDALPAGALVVEVGVGGRYETARALREERPDLKVMVTDVRPEAVAGAPAGMETLVDDVHRPDAALYAGAALVYAVRPGEEILPALARLCHGLRCTLAVRPLGTETADLSPWMGAGRVVSAPDGTSWHVFGV